jgi:hypothetical protein
MTRRFGDAHPRCELALVDHYLNVAGAAVAEQVRGLGRKHGKVGTATKSQPPLIVECGGGRQIVSSPAHSVMFSADCGWCSVHAIRELDCLAATWPPAVPPQATSRRSHWKSARYSRTIPAPRRQSEVWPTDAPLAFAWINRRPIQTQAVVTRRNSRSQRHIADTSRVIDAHPTIY